MTTVLAIGATSAMVFETLRCFAKENATLLLAGRNKEKLQTIKDDLIARGAKEVLLFENDLSTPSAAVALFDEVIKSNITVDTVYIGYGSLPDQNNVINDAVARQELFQTNLLSTMDHSLLWYKFFEQNQKQGTIAVISSVAGDRGRGSNFMYGATKAGLDAFLSGLRNVGAKKGISVLTIKPGFVDSPMTAHVSKNALFTSAAKAGQIIHNVIIKKIDISYIPSFWRFILLVVKMVPERIFKRLSL